ncbi:AbiJ-NTD4 domain-containing protein [Halarcobacter sp.]|uniref:AbiJ-NTD4 domain-containing protein n=1 Tax=Halarcobacter sp. TaxID=2321133 RepID=UPI003A8F7EF9
MRRKFSERNGYKNLRKSLQIESINQELKNRLWNNIKMTYLDTLHTLYNTDGRDLDNNVEIYKIKQLYDSFFKTHEEPPMKRGRLKDNIKHKYFNLEWYEVYDLIEYLPEIFKREFSTFYEDINSVLEEEGAGYRFVNGLIVQIIDEVEIQEVEEVFEIEYTPVKRHLSNALELLSDRENPDYPNSIKESITAVESMAKIITGKETDLANCLKTMDIDLNKQFKTAMTNLYGWTNKEDGIRHGHTGEELKTSFDEAKYMLVSCSAFINYLISKHES